MKSVAALSPFDLGRLLAKRVYLPGFALVLLLLVMAPALQAQSVLKGHDTSQEIDISADRLEVRQRENIALFSGAVKVTQGKMTLMADGLTVYYDTDGGADPSIQRLDAKGNVRLASDSETVTSAWGLYDVERRLVTFGGNVLLVRGDSRLTGDRLELNLISGLTKVDGSQASTSGDSDGRVRGRFAVPE